MILISRKKRRAMIAQLCLIAKAVTGLVDASDLSKEILRHDSLAVHTLFDLAYEIGGHDGLMAVKDYTVSGRQDDHTTHEGRKDASEKTENRRPQSKQVSYRKICYPQQRIRSPYPSDKP